MLRSIRFALVNSESSKVPSEWSAFSAWGSVTKAEPAGDCVFLKTYGKILKFCQRHPGLHAKW